MTLWIGAALLIVLGIGWGTFFATKGAWAIVAMDLVMLADQQLVFVEVRYRRGVRFGTAAESVDARKQQRLIRAAEDFLMRFPQFANHPCRFDVMALYGDADAPGCDWIAGAFSA